MNTELRRLFESETGNLISTTDGKINLSYVLWLEDKIIQKNVENRKEKEMEKNIKIWFKDYQDFPEGNCSPFVSTVKRVRFVYNLYLSDAKKLCDRYLKV